MRLWYLEMSGPNICGCEIKLSAGNTVYYQVKYKKNITRSKYMGVWGRLRFARKPICVIGESHESRIHLPPKVKSSKSFVDRNTPQNTFWSTFDHSEVDTLILIFPICNLPTFRPRLKCQKASSGYFTEYLARTLFCWEKLYLSFGHILERIFGEKGKFFGELINL